MPLKSAFPHSYFKCTTFVKISKVHKETKLGIFKIICNFKKGAIGFFGDKNDMMFKMSIRI